MGLLNRLSQYLLLLGLPGLMAISFLDSAAVPLPGGPDAIVALLSWRKPSQVFLIIAAAAAGSTAGCYVLYRIGRKGGELALSRFSPERRRQVKDKIDRHSFWTVTAAVMAPPPFPTKLVILAAGVFRVNVSQFLAGVLAGRLLRYSVMGFVGARFGDEAAQILKEHYPALSLALILLVVAVLIFRRLRR